MVGYNNDGGVYTACPFYNLVIQCKVILRRELTDC